MKPTCPACKREVNVLLGVIIMDDKQTSSMEIKRCLDCFGIMKSKLQQMMFAEMS